MRGESIVRVTLIVGCLLLVPLIAMQFTTQVAWDIADFVVAGVLLFGAGITYELLASRETGTGRRVLIGIVIVIALFLIWAELGVGILGTPFAGS